MKTRFVLTVALINAAALAAGYAYFTKSVVRQVGEERQAAQAEISVLEERAGEAERAAPAVVYRTNAFDWSQVESSDYRQYIANLRAIHCPENTLKDIIMTDVMRLYAQRRGKYYLNGHDFKYWETDEKRKLKQPQIKERERQLAAIDQELPAVLRELLGVNYEREVNKYFVDTDEDNRRLAFLSDDKRSQLLRLRDQFEGEREQVLYGLEGAVPGPAEREKLRQIEQEREAALSQLLTPGEKEQYLLSESPSADRLRQQLIGFNPSEGEFRSLFERQQAIDSAYEYEDTSDPSVENAKATEEQAMVDDFKKTLSSDRAAQFDLSQNPDYQNLCVLSERYDLPEGASQAILDMRQAAEAQKQQLLADKNLTPDGMDVALKAIQAETERAARETLGDAAYTQYSQNAAWIRNLGSN